jgi:HEAT repeat protein
MNKYPFDKSFIDAIEHLQGKDDADWIISQLLEDDPDYLKRLEDLGWETATTKSYMNWLREAPLSCLTAVALEDGEETSPAKVFLQQQTSREVFEAVKDLCQSADAWCRASGIEIMMRMPGKSFLLEAQELIVRIAETEAEVRVIEALAYALVHLEVPERWKFLVGWTHNSSAAARFAIAYSLGGCSDNLDVVNSLISLSRDVDEDVRDWATFGLGDLSDLDTPAIRDALVDRLQDDFIDARCEAIYGLAKRHDARVINALNSELQKDAVGSLVLDAVHELEGTPLADLIERSN